MSDGHMQVTVYSYEGHLERTVIGYPYVEDNDDWDVPDKKYTWVKSTKGFSLDNGRIVMDADVPAGQYDLEVQVTDPKYAGDVTDQARSFIKVNVIAVPHVAINNHVSRLN